MALSYMGGKQRISKQLSSFFNDKIISEQLYIEPFRGSCSVLEKIIIQIHVLNEILK